MGLAEAALQRAMRRALALAERGPRRDPNPRVGCVILDAAGAVVAEGWHRGSGTPHAEVAALTALPERLREPSAAAGLTLVASLEPCTHHGRTGPCARAIIDAGIGAVAYASTDPSPRAGGGGDMLRAAGVEVVAGLSREAADGLNEAWLTAERLGRPHVTIKWAQSLDGMAAAADGTSMWITGPEARADVHARRARADAIAVGIGTVLADDPALTARTPDGGLAPEQPVPVVFGHRSVPENARLARHPEPLLRFDGEDLAGALAELRQLGLHSVFVEGGPRLAGAFLDAGLADEVLVYVAPVLLGAGRPALAGLKVATLAEGRRLVWIGHERLGEDWRLTATPAPGSPAPRAPGKES